MGDIVGRLFMNLPLPLAVAILIRGGVADPDIDDARGCSAESLRNRTASPVPGKKFDRIIAAYGRGLAKVLNHPWLTLSGTQHTLLAAVGVI